MPSTLNYVPVLKLNHGRFNEKHKYQRYPYLQTFVDASNYPWCDSYGQADSRLHWRLPYNGQADSRLHWRLPYNGQADSRLHWRLPYNGQADSRLHWRLPYNGQADSRLHWRLPFTAP
ncbi:hypothetical protein ACOMHN_012668 [Nucella lapillus]